MCELFRTLSTIADGTFCENDWKSLTIFPKSYILDARQGSGYVSAKYKFNRFWYTWQYVAGMK